MVYFLRLIVFHLQIEGLFENAEYVFLVYPSSILEVEPAMERVRHSVGFMRLCGILPSAVASEISRSICEARMRIS